jgi:deoxyribonuclease V
MLTDPNAALIGEWKAEQLTLLPRLVTEDAFEPVTRIGGVDLSFPLHDETTAVACLVVLSYPQLDVIYKDFAITTLTYPYIAGYLAFREVQPLAALIDKLRLNRPDLLPHVILVDGNGVLHPRGFGLASHLGVVVDIPTVGVGKNFLQIKDGPQMSMRHVIATCRKQATDKVIRLVGKSGTIYGAAVRVANATNPIFVSIGHRISLDSAIHFVQTCSKFRIPEPTRQADILSRRYVKAHLRS